MTMLAIDSVSVGSHDLPVLGDLKGIIRLCVLTKNLLPPAAASTKQQSPALQESQKHHKDMSICPESSLSNKSHSRSTCSKS